jgi:DNA-binding NarL/FixJ family response regulator
MDRAVGAAWTIRAERARPGPARRRRAAKLTALARHRELLHLAAGHTNVQIARRLCVSEGTVRTHLENIYRLLQVSSRTAALVQTPL